MSVKVAELRVKPDSTAFSRLKLGAGRPVAVLGKSDDGQWIKVRAEFERGEDIVKLEGWVEANQLKGDLNGLAVASGGETGKGSASSASSSGASTDAAWDSSGSTASSADSGWGESGATAPAAEPAASGDTWGSEPAAAPAAEATPAPDASMGEWDMSEPAPTPTPESKPDEWDSGSGSGDSGSSGDSGDGW